MPSKPDEVVRLLSKNRGIGFEDVAKGTLSDPFLFSEMERAVERIERAMKNHETIAVFGDYDADGITATAQLVRFFRRHGIEPVAYLPDRLREGYGMKKVSIDLLKTKGVSLIVTVDNGIAAHAEIAQAAALGMDVIVTDHHRIQGSRPAAYAVIHPEIGDAFPNQHLSGSGVAFMLVRALEHGSVWNGIEQDVILAMIGTIGDVMPLTGENRTLVIHGLKLIAKLPPCPLKDLIDDVSDGKEITSGDIAFRVVPRINAAGRMQHPLLALDALLEGGDALESLHRLNGDRQSAIEDALSLVRPLVDWSQPFLFSVSDQVTSGIVGLIAGRLTEESGRPSLVASRSGELCTASLRSVPSVDVMTCLEHPLVRPLLLTCGGHAQAGGCTFAFKDAEKIQAGLSRAVSDLGHSVESLLPEIAIDHELPHAHLILSLAKALESLQPFGHANEQPLFLVKNLKVESVRSVGSENTHLQIVFAGHRGIAFRLGSLTDRLAPGSVVDVACALSINAWNGRESLQLMVKDIRLSA